MPEMDTAFKKLSCCDDGHGRVPSLPASARRRPVVQHRTFRRCLMLARGTYVTRSVKVKTESAARPADR